MRAAIGCQAHTAAAPCLIQLQAPRPARFSTNFCGIPGFLRLKTPCRGWGIKTWPTEQILVAQKRTILTYVTGRSERVQTVFLVILLGDHRRESDLQQRFNLGLRFNLHLATGCGQLLHPYCAEHTLHLCFLVPVPTVKKKLAGDTE